MTDLWELPAGWHWATMEEVAKVVGGSTPKTGEPSYWGGDIPWITPDDLSGFSGKYIERGRRSISQPGFDSCSTQMVPAGTVLFTSRAPIGYTAIARNAVCTNQGFKSFIPGPEVTSDYLFWYLQSAVELIRSMASGTTFREISGRAAATIPVPIPPRSEQDQVVAAIEGQLTRLQVGRGSIENGLRRLRQFRTAVLDAAIWGTLANGDPRRKGLGLSDLPTGWTWASVGELADRVQYGTSAKAGRDPEGVPVLRMGNIVDGRIVLKDLKYLPRGHSEFPELFLQAGDLLFNRTNSAELVGKSAVFGGGPEPCTFASYLIRVQTGPALSPDYLGYVLNSTFGRRWIRSVISQQVGQANVNGSKLKAFTIPLPPVEQQQRLVAEAERHMSTSETMAATIAAASRRSMVLRRDLLRQAFAGRLGIAA